MRLAEAGWLQPTAAPERAVQATQMTAITATTSG